MFFVFNECLRYFGNSKRQSETRWKTTMNLHLLDFDCSEDADGVTCWDALAHPQGTHTSALLQEAEQVLTWAHHWGRQFSATGPGPLEDGADWDFDLQVRLHSGPQSTCATATFLVSQGTLQLFPEPRAEQTLELSLSVSGTPGFADAFRQHWGAP
jgi:hypothetical protein